MALVVLAASALLVIGNLQLALRLQPALLHPRVDKAILRRLLGYGGGLTVAGAALVPLTTAERFFLAHNHSAAAVAYNAVAANLALVLQVLPEQLVAPLLPGMARLHASERRAELQSIYRKGLSVLFLLLTPAAILLCLVARPFMTMWAGPEYGLHSTTALLVLVVGVWFNCLAYLPNALLLSSGRTTTIAYIKTAEVVPYLAGAWVLTQHFGVNGAAYAWTARCAVDSILLFSMCRQVRSSWDLVLPGRKLRSTAGLPVLGGAALLVATLVHGVVARFAGAAVLALAYGVATWCLVLSSGERRRLLELGGGLRHWKGSRPLGSHGG